jgi:hypothetical protein
MNAVVEVATKEAQRDGETVPVVCVALDVHDAAGLQPFIKGAVEKFKLQRMLSPPTTAHLLITVVGNVSATP